MQFNGLVVVGASGGASGVSADVRGNLLLDFVQPVLAAGTVVNDEPVFDQSKLQSVEDIQFGTILNAYASRNGAGTVYRGIHTLFM
jgi:hypothetical protein